MITLEKLKELGAISHRCKEVFPKAGEVVPYTNFNFEKTAIPVVERHRWIATQDGSPVGEADVVYSSDGVNVATYERKNQTLFLGQVIDDRLATINSYNYRRAKDMPNVPTLKPNAMSALGDMANAATGAAMNVSSFSTDGKVNKKEADAARIRAIKASVEGSASVKNAEARIFNLKYGQFLFFITKTDPTVLLRMKQTVLKDVTGTPILVKDFETQATPEQKKQWAEKKKVPSKFYEKEKDFTFIHQKPGKYVGFVVATPEGGDSDILSLTREKAVDDTKTALQVHVLDNETGYCYLSYNYGDSIRECDKILGGQAGRLEFVRSIKEDKDGKRVIKTTLKHNKDKRKALIVEGNYVPLKLYKTISTQGMTPEQKVLLNNNVKALIKNGTDKFSEAALAAYTVDAATGAVTSDWFDRGAAINVKAYYDPEVELTDIQIAARTENEPKEAGKGYTYRFEYASLEDEDGPLSVARYADVAKLANMPLDDLKAELKPLAQVRRAVAQKETISADEYLKLKESKQYDVDGSKSFEAVVASLAKVDIG